MTSYDNANATPLQAAIGRLKDAEYILTVGKAHLRADSTTGRAAILAELGALRYALLDIIDRLEA